MGLFDQYLLTIITFLPLVTGLALLGTGAVAVALGRSGLPPALWRAVGLGSTGLTFALSLRLFAAFDPTLTGFQLVEYASWIPSYGIH